jgi:hypothetical protein
MMASPYSKKFADTAYAEIKHSEVSIRYSIESIWRVAGESRRQMADVRESIKTADELLARRIPNWR